MNWKNKKQNNARVVKPTEANSGTGGTKKRRRICQTA